MQEIQINIHELTDNCFNRICSLGLLPKLIRSEILRQISSSTKLSEDELFDARVEWAQKNRIFDESSFKAFQDEFLMTDAEVGELAAQPARIAHFIRKNFAFNLEKKFLEIKDDYEEFTFSIIKVRDEGLAQEIYIQIVEGESSFDALAKEHSLGIEKNTGGRVGPLLAKEINQDVLDLLRPLQTESLNPPVEVNGVWAILRIDNKEAATLTPKMEHLLSRKLFEEWLGQEVKQIIEYIKQNPQGDYCSNNA